jgi:16S rRNA (uracil1498-N3)-methyltransferase
LNLFYQPGIPDGILHLDADESRHCIKVLRKRSGDTIRITDGTGFFYDALITQADDRKCSFTIQEKITAPKRSHSIHIIISPTKNTDRIEWFVEKSTELGVERISLAECDHTERSFIKSERLQKVAVSAMKQSLKACLPEIGSLTSLTELITSVKAQEKFIAYVDPTNPSHLKDVATAKKSYCVLIGPEGDFSAEELSLAIESGFTKVSLGPSRLRTETAGLAACHILNLINE